MDQKLPLDVPLGFEVITENSALEGETPSVISSKFSLDSITRCRKRCR